MLTFDDAATKIQRCWRRHIDMQVFRYYRDLVNFKQKGDPSIMLRCINPGESKYLDAAAGVHVKFRLAGERFPPNIYYKIFTHRPVQDLCANSPKDYTSSDVKLQDCRQIHNKTDVRCNKKKDGWYERVENNGWRLVSDRMMCGDAVSWDTAQRKMNFHHDRLQRLEDVEKKKKHKKIEWMMKMYKDGMLQSKCCDDVDTAELVNHAAAGMVKTLNEMGEGAVEDWEVDELLQWTTGLNFDDYSNHWKEMATSAMSNERVDMESQLIEMFAADDKQSRLMKHRSTVSRGTTVVGAVKSNKISHNTPVSTKEATFVQDDL